MACSTHHGSFALNPLPQLLKPETELLFAEILHKVAWIKAGRITKDEFYAWSEKARAKRDECDAGKLTLEEFEVWLKQS